MRQAIEWISGPGRMVRRGNGVDIGAKVNSTMDIEAERPAGFDTAETAPGAEATV